MKKSIFLTLLVITFKLHASCFDPVLRGERTDGVPMPKGPLKGQCLAIEDARPVISKSLTDAEFILDEISHDGEFYRLQFNPDDIREAIFQMERFPPEWIAAHTQVRITFRPQSIRLLKKSSAGYVQTGLLSDLIISNEALGVSGFTYGLIPGAFNQFVLVTRMTSLDEKIRTMIGRDRHTVNQLPLNLNQGEIERLIRLTLAKASQEKLGAMYSTLVKNCATDLFLLLKLATKDRTTRNELAYLEFLPIAAPKILNRLGLLDESRVLPDLNIEISGLQNPNNR